MRARTWCRVSLFFGLRDPASRPGCFEPRVNSFFLSSRSWSGQSRENTEDHFAGRCGCVDVGSLACQHFLKPMPRSANSSTMFTRCFEIPPQPIQFPHDQRVLMWSKCFQAIAQFGPVIGFAGGLLCIYMQTPRHFSFQKRIDLEIQRLASVRLLTLWRNQSAWKFLNISVRWQHLYSPAAVSASWIVFRGNSNDKGHPIAALRHNFGTIWLRAHFCVNCNAPPV